MTWPKIERDFKSLLLLIPIILIFFQRPFPETIFSLDELDIYTINQNRSYFSYPLVGRIMENKGWRYLSKFKENFFQGLDLNYYFFANHPRERAGIKEREIFPWFSLPLFLFSVYLQLKEKRYFGMIYFLTILVFISLFKNFDSYFYYLLPYFIYSFIYLVLRLNVFKV